MSARGWAPRVRLAMGAEDRPPVMSRNVVAEIRGSERPDEVVLLSGHLDSWDVGSGAIDDGGGVVIGWQALTAIAALPARPRRTVRLVLWCSEELGGGSRQYWKDHANETDRMNIVMESDSGANPGVASHAACSSVLRRRCARRG